MTKRVAVLMGGWSVEREVSLNSGAACCKALCEAGFDAFCIDLPRNPADLLTALNPRPDVVFNALHGRFGEDGHIQAILNLLNIPYTHSGLLASAIAMDKHVAKTLFAAAGIPVPEGKLLTREAWLAADPMPRPYVIKPYNEGSSVGVHILLEGSNSRPLSADEWPFGDLVMVERYIPGRELTVAVMGERALGVLEITSNHIFYDYEAKYAPEGSRHILPAPVPPAIYEEAGRLAVLAHQALGCRGVSRADFRYDETDAKTPLYLLEVNTQPGMTATSLVPDIAAYAGLSFPELVAWMVENARCDA